MTLAAPSDGYLVYRNEDVAHYMCNVNFVFVDTRQRARLIWCYDDNRWNDTVPLCVGKEKIILLNKVLILNLKMLLSCSLQLIRKGNKISMEPGSKDHFVLRRCPLT